MVHAVVLVWAGSVSPGDAGTQQAGGERKDESDDEGMKRIRREVCEIKRERKMIPEFSVTAANSWQMSDDMYLRFMAGWQ